MGEAEVRSRAARVVDDEHDIDEILLGVAGLEGAGGAESLRRRCRRPSFIVAVAVVDMVDPDRSEVSIKCLGTARSPWP